LYHAGLRKRVAGSTLADANEPRDWLIYADLVRTLIGEPMRFSSLPREPGSSRIYPKTLRWITFRDQDSGKRVVFLTNYFRLPALTIAELYESRGRSSLSLSIKQYLPIRAFCGDSLNAVKTHVWIAVSTYRLPLFRARHSNPLLVTS
jgi:hypothetical protein